MKKGLIVTLLIVIVGVSGFFGYKYFFKEEFRVKTFEKKIELNYGEEFIENSGNICYGNNIKCKKVDVTSSGDVDTKKIGEYKRTYTYTYKGKKYEVEQTIEVVDKEKPTITIDDKNLQVCPNGKYSGIKYKAIDNVDGDITSKVTVKYEDNKLILSVTDSSNNIETREIETEAKDTKAPTINLRGDKAIYLAIGDKYNEKGATAKDNCDEKLDIKTEGSVDTSKIGTYKITYSTQDSSNNKSTVQRIVYVDKIVHRNNSSTINKGDKIVYLTFDDGPSYLTPDFLKVLDKYNVKATFFVTNQFPKYQYLLKEEAKKGHTVAVHTYSHSASWSMYNSLSAYLNDFNKMNNIIEKQTGSKSILFRFPGGSSNTVSIKKKKGVVTEIANYMKKRGFIYFDWNVSSGDAGGTTNPDRIAQNVINGVHRTGTAVVLCHDIKVGTLKALPKIIKTLTKEGYVFKPLDESSPTTHQKIAN